MLEWRKDRSRIKNKRLIWKNFRYKTAIIWWRNRLTLESILVINDQIKEYNNEFVRVIRCFIKWMLTLLENNRIAEKRFFI